MKHAITLLAAAGLASVLALPASAETGQRSDGLRDKAQVNRQVNRHAEHTDISSRRYYRNYGYRGYRPYRYGYYRPYYSPYYGPYAYGPSFGFGFGGGPRFGVWF